MAVRIEFHESLNIKGHVGKVMGSSLLEAISIIAVVGGILCLVIHPNSGFIHDMAHFITEKGAKAAIGVGTSLAVINGLALLYLGFSLHIAIKDKKNQTDKCLSDSEVVKMCEKSLKNGIAEGEFYTFEIKRNTQTGYVLQYREWGQKTTKFLIFKESHYPRAYVREHLKNYSIQGEITNQDSNKWEEEIINALSDIEDENVLKPFQYHEKGNSMLMIAWREKETIKYKAFDSDDSWSYFKHINDLITQKDFKIDEASAEFIAPRWLVIDHRYTELYNYSVTESTYHLQNVGGLYLLIIKDDQKSEARYFFTHESRSQALEKIPKSLMNHQYLKQKIAKSKEIQQLYNKIATDQFIVCQIEGTNQNKQAFELYLGLYKSEHEHDGSITKEFYVSTQKEQVHKVLTKSPYNRRGV